MRVDRDVAARTNQVFTLDEGDVAPRFWIYDEPCKAEINHVNKGRVLAQTHHHVVRLDVPVDVVLAVHVLDALQNLIEEHEGGLEGELLAAQNKQVFQTGPQQLGDHENKFVFHADTLLDEFGKAHRVERVEVLDLSQQLGEGLGQGFCLDCHWIVVVAHVIGHVHFTKGALSDFLD